MHMQQIADKKEQILYIKKGKKYVPITDPWAYSGLSEGWWLVKVAPGATTIRQCVWPDKAHIQAAALDKKDNLVDIIRDASTARPSKVHLRPDEKRDWDWFIKKHGKEFSTLQYPSFDKNAEDIVKALTEY